MRAAIIIKGKVIPPAAGSTPEACLELLMQGTGLRPMTFRPADGVIFWNGEAIGFFHDYPANAVSDCNPNNLTIFYCKRNSDTWMFWCVCNRTTLETQRATLQERRFPFIVNDHTGRQIEEWHP